MNKLQDQLDQITARTRELVPADRLAPSENSVEMLFSSGVEQKILPVGALMPAFTLADVTGKNVHSDDLLALGPLVIDFFRGRWCPYCVTELETWRDLYPSLRERGALIAAISPQTRRQNDYTALEHNLPFPVLADPGCQLATRFGLTYAVPEPLREVYQSTLVNLPFINEDDRWLLPLPATYLVAPDGRIVYAEAHADFRVRPEPTEILDALDAL